MTPQGSVCDPENTMARPFEGIRVIDVTHVLAVS